MREKNNNMYDTDLDNHETQLSNPLTPLFALK